MVQLVQDYIHGLNVNGFENWVGRGSNKGTLEDIFWWSNGVLDEVNGKEKKLGWACCGLKSELWYDKIRERSLLPR